MRMDFSLLLRIHALVLLTLCTPYAESGRVHNHENQGGSPTLVFVPAPAPAQAPAQGPAASSGLGDNGPWACADLHHSLWDTWTDLQGRPCDRGAPSIAGRSLAVLPVQRLIQTIGQQSPLFDRFPSGIPIRSAEQQGHFLRLERTGQASPITEQQANELLRTANRIAAGIQRQIDLPTPPPISASLSDSIIGSIRSVLNSASVGGRILASLATQGRPVVVPPGFIPKFLQALAGTTTTASPAPPPTTTPDEMVTEA